MNKFRDLETLLNLFEEQPSYKLLLNAVPIKKFFSVQNWPQVQKHLHRYLVFLLHRPILLHSKLEVETEKSFAMSIGHLHYLLSGKLSVGYLVEFPKNVKLEVTQSFIAAIMGKVGTSPSSVTELPPVQHELRDKYLSVYHQCSTQVVAVQSNLVDFLN